MGKKKLEKRRKHIRNKTMFHIRNKTNVSIMFAGEKRRSLLGGKKEH